MRAWMHACMHAHLAALTSLQAHLVIAAYAGPDSNREMKRGSSQSTVEALSCLLDGFNGGHRVIVLSLQPPSSSHMVSYFRNRPQ